MLTALTWRGKPSQNMKLCAKCICETPALSGGISTTVKVNSCYYPSVHLHRRSTDALEDTQGICGHDMLMGHKANQQNVTRLAENVCMCVTARSFIPTQKSSQKSLNLW